METDKKFLRLHLEYGSACNECRNDNTTIVFIEVCDDKLEADTRKIAATCRKPSISVHETCTKNKAYYVDDVISSLDSIDVRVNVVHMNSEKRQIITNTAANATRVEPMSWYCTSDSVKVRYADFYYKVLYP